MSLQFDQLNNQLKTNDSTNANASMVLTPAGTGSVQVSTSGSNLFLQSSNLTAANWNATNNITVTGSQSDPFGGTTAALLTDTATNAGHFIYQSVTTSTQTVTFSVYAKAGTANGGTANNFIILAYSSTVGAAFNLTTGAVVSVGLTAPILSSATNVGNGWWRLSVTVSSATVFFDIQMTNGTALSYAGTGSTVFVSSPQLEVGSIANAFVATTTAAIYNAPVLSFSGAANIGLQSDGALYVQPAGTGALQAQATTSSTVGGNARGANATDWQTSRSSAGQVASASQAVIGGGASNTASGAYSVVGGGNTNLNQGAGDFIGGGNGNATASNFALVVGGQGNSANGFYNVIGGGYTNSGTSSSTVTTQTSATTSGSTAVTLAASNASIKVGQMVRGTGIQDYSYVAAISGTSLTLSQNANSTQASTNLQFYTPHGVVVGGGNNQATGSYSFIGGGGDAGTAANRNVASGDWSFVGGGIKNVASGLGSVVCGGGIGATSTPFSNQATGGSCFVGSGVGNQSTGSASFVGSGYQNLANADYSAIMNGVLGTTRGIVGNQVSPACNNPNGSGTAGSSQSAILILARQTTDATATVLTSNTSAASGTNQVILPNNSAYFFTGEVVSGVTGGGDTKGWTIEGVIKRGAGVGTTALVGTPTVTSMYADVGAATWALAVTADTTNGGLAVTFTGQASTTIRTVAQIRTTEMTY
jgi:hypothetical protein